MTEVWQPVPRIVDAQRPIPSDAIVLFDGTNANAWEQEDGGPVRWRIVNGALVVNPDAKSIRTKESFGDIQLHLEFRTAPIVEGKGQKRGNSGVFFMMEYELQILDSFDNETYVNGQAAAVYKQHPPLVNASRPPGAWQTSASGRLLVQRRWQRGQRGANDGVHNGVLVQHDVVLRGRAENRGDPRLSPPTRRSGHDRKREQAANDDSTQEPDVKLIQPRRFVLRI